MLSDSEPGDMGGGGCLIETFLEKAAARVLEQEGDGIGGSSMSKGWEL